MVFIYVGGTKAAREQWPGNSIPCFRNNKENIALLDSLKDRLDLNVLYLYLESMQ